jgi:hypothetical protein
MLMPKTYATTTKNSKEVNMMIYPAPSPSTALKPNANNNATITTTGRSNAARFPIVEVIGCSIFIDLLVGGH